MKKGQRNIFLIFFIVAFTVHKAKCQDSTSRFSDFHLRGIIGTKIFNPWADFSGRYMIYKGSLYFPPILGFEIYDSKSNLSFDFRQHLFTSFSVKNPNLPDVLLFRLTTLIGITYSFKKKSNNGQKKIGIAYSHTYEKSINASVFSALNNSWGFSMFFSFPLKWLDVELRAEPVIAYFGHKPAHTVFNFAGGYVNGDKFSIHLVYRFERRKTSEAPPYNNVKDKSACLNLIVGLKVLKNRSYYAINNDDNYLPIATVPEIGIEYYFARYKFSFDFRRSLWLSLAQNRQYAFDGYTETLLAGANYYLLVKKKAIKFGLANAWIRDNALGLLFPVGKIDFYPEKGIALAMAYPVGKIDLEFRAIYAYHVNSQIQSEVVNPFDVYRLSIGVVYRINKRE